MALTGRAGAAALGGALVVLAVRTGGALLAVNGVLLAAIAADLLLAAPVSGLQVTRAGAGQALLGETAAVTVTVRNTARRPLRAAVRPTWQPSAHATPHHFRVRLPPGGEVTLTTALAPDRRGEKTSPAVVVRSFGPCGLAARQDSRPAAWSVRVLPPFRSRRHLAAKLSQLRQLDGQHRTLLRGPGTEFDSLREYVVGDDVRSIDWRAVARRGDVVVRTWRPERDRRLLVVLDTGRTSAGRVAGIPRLDAAMDATLLLTALAARAGDRVDLIAFDRRLRARVLGVPGPSVLAAVTAAMAPLESALTETDAAGLASAVAAVARHRTLIVLFTDLNPTVIEGSLLPALRALAARNRLMIASVADPRLAQMAAARDSAADLYDAAAAEVALAERQRIATVLRRRGVQVVEAPPDRLPPALADAYLALKAAGQL